MSGVSEFLRQTGFDGENVRRNAAGNPVKSVRHSITGISSILRALPKRVDYGEVDMPDLSELAALHEVLNTTVAEVVHRLRQEVDQAGRPAWSWADIGRALGITRQAAQITYGRRRHRAVGE